MEPASVTGSGGSIRAVNLAEAFSRIPALWQPHIAGELNDDYVKLARLHGEFVWHSHEHEDEMFLVVRGELRILLRDGDLCIGPGEFAIIPRGVEHKPMADEETWVLLFEPQGTLNTGDAQDARTLRELPRL